jgi:small subunit ribosomal protein S24e
MGSPSSGKVAVVKEGAELRVVSERFNKLIRRLEVEAVVTHQGMSTPSRRELIEVLSKLYSKSPELVIVRKIESEYGVGVSRVYAYIYEDPDRLKSFEPKHILKRHGVGV